MLLEFDIDLYHKRVGKNKLTYSCLFLYFVNLHKLTGYELYLICIYNILYSNYKEFFHSKNISILIVYELKLENDFSSYVFHRTRC